MKKVKIGLNNLYLFPNEKAEYILIDTGLKCDEEKIVLGLEKEIGSIDKIKVIVITHSHDDHIGNLKMLTEKIKNQDLTVILHIGAKNAVLYGEKNIPGGFYKITRFISRKIKEKALKEVDRDKGNQGKKQEYGKERLLANDIRNIVFLDFEKYDEYSLGKYGFSNLKIIYTPGHTMDSISLVYESSENKAKYLFCGDMVQNLLWKKPLVPLFGDDIDKLMESWEKISSEKYGRIYPATGKYVITQDLDKVLKKYEKNRV